MTVRTNGFGRSYLPDLQAVTQSGLIPGEKLLQLNCLQLGDPINNIFPIEIGDNETVGALKKSIKEKKRPVFDHIPADNLFLWKVFISVDTLHMEDLDQLSKEEETLKPIQVLSDVFSNNLDRTHLHVVVVMPQRTGKFTRLSVLITILTY